MNKLLLLGAVVVAACGGPSSPAARTEPVERTGTTVTMTCEGMAGNLAARRDPELRPTVVEECNDKAWSQDAINCMAAAVSDQDIQRCKGSMTPGQQESLSTSTGW